MALRQRQFSRDEFLARSLDFLSEEGGGNLRLDRLVGWLGVDKERFYSHFDTRADFVRSLTEYWVSTTQLAIGDVQAMEGGPGVRLFGFMRRLGRRELAGRDHAMRTWASREPEVASAVEKVDRLRLTFVRGLLEEMGFEGEDLETRTRIFVTALSFEREILVTEPRRDRSETLRHWYEFFTRP